MAAPSDFDWTQRKNGEVVITHHGRIATVLRGDVAADFVSEIDSGDPQQLMARATGNYKRGNERAARRHPRNRQS
jgi:hypothetical protein